MLNNTKFLFYEHSFLLLSVCVMIYCLFLIDCGALLFYFNVIFQKIYKFSEHLMIYVE